MPLLTQIAHGFPQRPVHLLPDTLIFRDFRNDRFVFRVLNYLTNYLTHFKQMSMVLVGLYTMADGRDGNSVRIVVVDLF